MSPLSTFTDREMSNVPIIHYTYEPAPVELPPIPWWVPILLGVKNATFIGLGSTLMLISGDTGPTPLPDIGPYSPPVEIPSELLDGSSGQAPPNSVAGGDECKCEKRHPKWPQCPDPTPLAASEVAELAPKPPPGWTMSVGNCGPRKSGRGVADPGKCPGSEGVRIQCTITYTDPTGKQFKRDWGVYKCKCCFKGFEGDYYNAETHFAAGRNEPWKDPER